MLFDKDLDERTLTAVRSHLHDTTFGAAWAEGQAMTLDEAIAYAREGL